jgi:hypothetical protein
LSFSDITTNESTQVRAALRSTGKNKPCYENNTPPSQRAPHSLFSALLSTRVLKGSG